MGDEGIGWVHPGECGKVYRGPWGAPCTPGSYKACGATVVNYTKRNNSASVPTPWVTAGNGGGGPGATGAGQVVPVFAWECTTECNCTLHPAASDSGTSSSSTTTTTSASTAPCVLADGHSRCTPAPCSEVYPNPNPHPKPNRDPSSLTGMCEVACGQAFNDKLANLTVQLYCDPNDPNCDP